MVTTTSTSVALEMTTAVLPDEDTTLGEGYPSAQHTLRFNVSFEVGKKKILHNAYAELVSGECLAIMGPSGGIAGC